jgi:hypothetical protein
MTVFLSNLPVVSCVAGLGLRRQTPWASRVAVVLGFVLFGGIPVGTGLAVYLGRFAASSRVRQEFQRSARAGATI